MNIQVVEDSITVAALHEIAEEFYAPMIKGVVDIEKELVAFGGEYHMDANNILVERGSIQENLWGFNIYLDRPRESWIEFTALINIRPINKNTVMEITDSALRDTMSRIIQSKIL